MTNEKLFMVVTEIVRSFAELEKDNYGITETAEDLIKDPASWLAKYEGKAFHPALVLMKDCGLILEECVAKMNTGSGDEKKAAAAAKRYYKTAHAEGARNPALDGIWKADGYYNICDSHRILRLKKDRPEIPHLQYEGDKIKVGSLMEQSINDCNKVILPIPEIAEVKAFLASEKARIKGKKGAAARPFIIKDEKDRPLIGIDPQFIIDAIEALPGAVWYGSNDIKPVYIVGEEGDSLLLPCRIRNAENGAEEISQAWEDLRSSFTKAEAASAGKKQQSNNEGAETAPTKKRRRSAKKASEDAEQTQEAEALQEGASAEEAQEVKADPAEVVTASAETAQEAQTEEAQKAETAAETEETEEAEEGAGSAEGKTYTIKKARFEKWGYEITAPGFHNVAPSIEAARQYLKDRFGLKVKICVLEETPTQEQEAKKEDPVITAQETQEAQETPTQDNYTTCADRDAGRRQKGAEKATPTQGGRRKAIKPTPGSRRKSAVCASAGRKAAGSGGGGSGSEETPHAPRPTPHALHFDSRKHSHKQSYNC